MDIDEAIKKELHRYSNRNALKAEEFIFGTYSLDDKFDILLLHGSMRDDLEMLFCPAHYFNDTHDYIDRVARALNQYEDRPNRTMTTYCEIRPVGFYTEDENDPDHVYIELFAVEEYGSRIKISNIRKLIKRNFSKYRLAASAKVIQPNTYLGKIYNYVKNTLTRRKFVVKVTKQELMYHTLTGKFRKKT